MNDLFKHYSFARLEFVSSPLTRAHAGLCAPTDEAFVADDTRAAATAQYAVL